MPARARRRHGALSPVERRVWCRIRVAWATCDMATGGVTVSSEGRAGVGAGSGRGRATLADAYMRIADAVSVSCARVAAINTHSFAKT